METVCPLARAILIKATLLVADDMLIVPNVIVNVPLRATLAAISAPLPQPINVLTGLKKLFSGFEKPIVSAAKLNGLEYSSLIFELGNRKLVAGQEDLILEVAQKMKERKL